MQEKSTLDLKEVTLACFCFVFSVKHVFFCFFLLMFLVYSASMKNYFLEYFMSFHISGLHLKSLLQLIHV